MALWLPFFGETDAEGLAKVRLGNFSFNAADWKDVSEDAKNFFRMLLEMNPRDRFTADQALNHDWIKNKAPKAVNVSLQQGFVDNLRGSRSAHKFKKAALHVVANQMDSTKLKQLKDIFISLDSNNDGTATVSEMKSGLEKAKKEKLLEEIPTDLESIMRGVDADGSGVINYTEFLGSFSQGFLFQVHCCGRSCRPLRGNGCLCCAISLPSLSTATYRFRPRGKQRH